MGFFQCTFPIPDFPILSVSDSLTDISWTSRQLIRFFDFLSLGNKPSKNRKKRNISFSIFRFPIYFIRTLNGKVFRAERNIGRDE